MARWGRRRPLPNAPKSAPAAIAAQIDAILDNISATAQQATAFTNFEGATPWAQRVLQDANEDLLGKLEDIKTQYDAFTKRAFGEYKAPWQPKRNPFVDEGRIGHRWGSAGSGILFAHGDEILLFERSPDVMAGGTWGITGGAIPVDSETGERMDAYASALKETLEEVGTLPPGAHSTPVEEYVWRALDSPFTYTTFTVELPRAARVNWEPILNWEHTDWGWYTPSDALMHLNLHDGVRTLLERS